MIDILLLGIFFACTSEDPSCRPSAKTILEILDSHEIWHASTERWNRLGDERGVLLQTIAIDDSRNTETDDSSIHSDSVIELSSDEEEIEDDFNEESDDSSDIEIIEEIPYRPHQNKEIPNEGKESSGSKPTEDGSTVATNDKEEVEDENDSTAEITGAGDSKLLDDEDGEGNSNHLGTNVTKGNDSKLQKNKDKEEDRNLNNSKSDCRESGETSKGRESVEAKDGD